MTKNLSEPQRQERAEGSIIKSERKEALLVHKDSDSRQRQYTDSVRVTSPRERLGKIPTSSPTASRRSRQIFLTLAASLGFQTHKGDVKCAFLQGDLDEQHADDNDDNFKIESAQPVSDAFCEHVPELSRNLQLEHHQCVRSMKAVHGFVNSAPAGLRKRQVENID